MTIFAKLISFSCLVLFTLLVTSCQDEAEGEGRVANPLSPQQVTRMFFEAYRDFDKAAARKVSNQEVVDELDWDRSAPRGADLKLEGDSIHDGAKVIQLEILSDGHVGASIAEIKVTDG